jgi:hypothetical protein
MQQGLLPITIGITGHRDLREEDIPILERSLDEIFRRISKQCPASPIHIISALAEGADRIAVKIALSRGMKVIVPLPMKRELYEQDFTTEESKQEFDDLLRKAEECFELPLLTGTIEEDIRNHGEARDKQYAFVGAYIARYSHAIIALWDGDTKELTGGTSYVVGFKLRGIPPPYVAMQGRFEPEETGVVYQIVTPRKSLGLPREAIGTIKIHYPVDVFKSEIPEKKYDDILIETNTFNGEILKLLPTLQKERQQSKSYLTPALPDFLADKRTNNLTEYFSAADTLAIYYQKKTKKYLQILFAAAMGATMTFEFYAYILTDSPEVLAFLFILLLCAYGLFFISARKRIQDKFQDYRALAEGLRIQFYWKLADIDESVANNYLKEQRSELDWIRHGLRSWSLPLFKSGKSLLSLSPEEEKLRWDIIINGWINDQYNYFAKSSEREIKLSRRMSRMANIFLFAGFALIAVNMIYHFSIGHTALPVVLYIASILPIAAGLLFGYSDKRSFEAHARQYEKMAALFAKAKHHINESIQVGEYAEAREILHELGKEALKENGDWVLTHRQRPIEVPLA